MRPVQLGGAPVRTADEVVDRLRARGRILVALSGGVDSGVVASLAVAAAGRGALAVTLTSSAVASEEVAAAREVAAAVGIRHVTLEADPLSNAGYRRNDAERCYHCRSVETEALRRYGDPLGVAAYLDGVHRDDLGEIRPGLRAMDEAGFEHPLLEAGWGKFQVRAYARARGLPNWDRPSNACLASRIPHGVEVSSARLALVDSAERAIRGLGFRQVRVRLAEHGARVEVEPESVERLLEPVTAGRARAELARMGLDPVELDPHGYAPARRA